VIRSHNSNEPLYYGLAGGKDIDGDSIPDYAIGTAGPFFTFVMTVYSGQSGSKLFEVYGNFNGEASFTGDLDGDGSSELLVSGPGRVFSSRDHSVLYQFDGYGSTVGAGGDFDGDGIGDLVLDDTATHEAVVFSGATGTELMRVAGGAPP
jgi:hypothetical protein